jgi:hypothetical protein
MKRVGFFKRIGKPIYIGGSLVRTNDVIKADFEFIMEQREGGWLFIQPKVQPKAQPNQPQRPINQPQPSFEPTIIKTDPITAADEFDAIKEVTNLYESIEKEQKAKWEEANPAPAPIEVNIDKLKELKKLSNKEWFSVTKEQATKLLTDANIDFSHVQKTKWELVKFIKGIIKDL